MFSLFWCLTSLNHISPPKHSNLWRSFCTGFFRNSWGNHWSNPCWLMVFRHPSEKWWTEFVSWDDEIHSLFWMESHKIPWFQSPPIRLEVWLKITEPWFRGVWFFHGKGSSHNFSLAPSPNYEWTQRWGHWTVGLRCLQANYYYRRYNWVVLS